MPISYTRNCHWLRAPCCSVVPTPASLALGLKINAVGDKPRALQLLWGKTRSMYGDACLQLFRPWTSFCT
ncbi:hypothetical protein CGCSCA1_v008498 [Colletotrichum siamense]|nr:hypothetical protein CGCSCA1_v008498 [Colletotrichum siamense]